MFLKRWLPPSVRLTLICLQASLWAFAEIARPPGVATEFEADGDVHVIAEHLVLVGHHIAHMDAQAEFHGAIGGEVAVALGHQRLHLDGGLDGANDAWKLEQEAVARVLHQAAAMIEDDRVNGASMGLEGGVRARLVRPHHARITGDIGTDDGG